MKNLSVKVAFFAPLWYNQRKGGITMKKYENDNMNYDENGNYYLELAGMNDGGLDYMVYSME